MIMNNYIEWSVPPSYADSILGILEDTYGINIIINTDKICILRFEGKDYYLSDNGGEFNLDLINYGYIGSIPYHMWGTPVSASTAAFRINEKLLGKCDSEIDWDLEL